MNQLAEPKTIRKAIGRTERRLVSLKNMGSKVDPIDVIEESLVLAALEKALTQSQKVYRGYP